MDQKIIKHLKKVHLKNISGANELSGMLYDDFFDIGKFVFERHPQREMLFVVRGTSLFSLAERVFHIKSGDMLLIDSWERHAAGYLPNDDKLLHIWWQLSPTSLKINLLGVENGNYRMIRHDSLPFDCAMIANRYWDEKKDMKKLLKLLLAESIELLLTERKSDPVRTMIEDVCRHIENVNGKDCSMRTLAALNNCSVSHLAHKFREIISMSVGDYIDMVRLKYTESAFAHGLSQKETASELGFSSGASFWKWLNKKRKFKTST